MTSIRRSFGLSVDVLCFHCSNKIAPFFQPYKWTLMTKHWTRALAGSGMGISEDTNAIKEIYASHLKLIAGIRLGLRSGSASVFSVSIEAAEQGEGGGTPLHQCREQTELACLCTQTWKVRYCGMPWWFSRKSWNRISEDVPRKTSNFMESSKQTWLYKCVNDITLPTLFSDKHQLGLCPYPVRASVYEGGLGPCGHPPLCWSYQHSAFG